MTNADCDYHGGTLRLFFFYSSMPSQQPSLVRNNWLNGRRRRLKVPRPLPIQRGSAITTSRISSSSSASRHNILCFGEKNTLTLIFSAVRTRKTYAEDVRGQNDKNNLRNLIGTPNSKPQRQCFLLETLLMVLFYCITSSSSRVPSSPPCSFHTSYRARVTRNTTAATKSMRARVSKEVALRPFSLFRFLAALP